MSLNRAFGQHENHCHPTRVTEREIRDRWAELPPAFHKLVEVTLLRQKTGGQTDTGRNLNAAIDAALERLEVK